MAGIGGKPQRNDDAGLHRPEQEERPKSIGKQRRSAICPQIDHRRHEVIYLLGRQRNPARTRPLCPITNWSYVPQLFCGSAKTRLPKI
jgi:hypothetical protein